MIQGEKKTNTILYNALTKMYKNKKKTFLPSVYEILLCIMIVVSGFMVGTALGIYSLESWMFWLKMIILIIAVVFLFTLVKTTIIKSLTKYESFLVIKEKYYSLIEKRELDFKDFLYEFNIQIKKDVYVDRINKKIYRLEHKLSNSYNNIKKEKLNDKISLLRNKFDKTFLDNNCKCQLKNVDLWPLKM